MKLCIWDCETTGLPDFKLPADHPTQPHICEVAAVVVDSESEHELDFFASLIRPDGWSISAELTAIHGISTQMCLAEGMRIADALDRLHGMIRETDVTLSYGFRFDDKMRRGACRRHGIPDLFGTFAWACVQSPVSAACQMPATAKMMKAGLGRRFKTPKLGEAVQILLGESHEGAHRALADVRATVRCLFAAKRAGYSPTITNPGEGERVEREVQMWPSFNPDYETIVDPHAPAKADDLGVI